jgi:hypothetical protein
MMNLTGRLGQASAAALGCDSNGDTRKSAAARIENAQAGFAGLLMYPPGGRAAIRRGGRYGAC